MHSTSTYPTIGNSSNASSSVKEISWNEAMERLLSDSRIADVELEGEDGVRLPGCKALLAARSEVMERLFFGTFLESSESVVKLGYPGSVLKALVRYCYTDDVDLKNLDGSNTNKVTTLTIQIKTSSQCSATAISTSCSSEKAFIHHLLLLADAANYFELSQLRDRIVLIAKVLLDENPEFSFCFLEESKCVGCHEILQEASHTIQLNLQHLLTVSRDSIRDLSPLSLMEVLQATHSSCEERLLFQLLEVWVSSSEDDSYPDRCRIARDQLSSNLRLDLIPASILEKQVASVNWINERDIFMAYREQAKQAEQKMELLNKRSARRWKGSKTTLFQYDPSDHETVEFLASERLSSGVYSWKLVIESLSENMFLGVEGGKHDFWLGYNGVRWRDKIQTGQGQLVFRTKSVVTMTLDLTRGGTLSATIDDSDPEVLFKKMMTSDDTSFVPAVCIKKSGSVRFVGLRKILTNVST
jgi:BTB/POZ domain